MSLFTLSEKPLSQDTIFKMLTDVRNNALAPFSNYKVGAVVEVSLSENLYFYTSGVNVEDHSHNRLSLHGEQNALANAITLLGGHTEFSSLWVMAAAVDAVPDPNQIAGKSCGHCRQIMVSLAQPGAQIYAVTLDGRFTSPPDNFEAGQFLPDPFSEKDLNPQSPNSNLHTSSINFHRELQAWEVFNQSNKLSADKIKEYLQRLSPHIINQNFQTSPITACIARCNNGYYAPGVLMQDVAFLTTDAIYAVIGNAVRRFGGENLRFDEMHIISNDSQPGQFTSAEIESLTFGGYTHDQTMVHFYTPDQHTVYSFEQCRHARSKLLDGISKGCLT